MSNTRDDLSLYVLTALVAVVCVAACGEGVSPNSSEVPAGPIAQVTIPAAG